MIDITWLESLNHCWKWQQRWVEQACSSSGEFKPSNADYKMTGGIYSQDKHHLKMITVEWLLCCLTHVTENIVKMNCTINGLKSIFFFCTSYFYSCSEDDWAAWPFALPLIRNSFQSYVSNIIWHNLFLEELKLLAKCQEQDHTSTTPLSSNLKNTNLIFFLAFALIFRAGTENTIHRLKQSLTDWAK